MVASRTAFAREFGNPAARVPYRCFFGSWRWGGAFSVGRGGRVEVGFWRERGNGRLRFGGDVACNGERLCRLLLKLLILKMRVIG